MPAYRPTIKVRKWRARIKRTGDYINAGYFKTKNEAAKAEAALRVLFPSVRLQVKPHGTNAGYWTHHRRGQLPACPDCKFAHKMYNRRRR